MKVQFDQPRGYKGFTTIYLFINRNAQEKSNFTVAVKNNLSTLMATTSRPIISIMLVF